MFLLPVFIGILVCALGPESSVLGTRHNVNTVNANVNGAAEELEEYDRFLNEIYQYEKKLNKKEHRKQPETKVGSPDWQEVDSNAYLDTKAVQETNLGAEDESHPHAAHDVVNGGVPAVTGTSVEVSSPRGEQPQQPAHANHSAPLPPQRQRQDTVIPKQDFIFFATVTGCSIVGLVGLIMAGVCWYKLRRRVKAASDVDYPAYGVTGPTKERLPSPGDRKLAQSAQMYHYQHQKQQMIAMEKANGEMKHDASEDESDEENEEGDYTVYECPGLAPTGEMEVRNPLFTGDAQTPVNGESPTIKHSEADQHDE